jgi:hypothetical protein
VAVRISEVVVTVTSTDVSQLKRKNMSFTTEIPVRNPVEISIVIPVVCRGHDSTSGSLSPPTARPLVANGGTASNMEVSCECIE